VASGRAEYADHPEAVLSLRADAARAVGQVP
jgi:hypothetical protein